MLWVLLTMPPAQEMFTLATVAMPLRKARIQPLLCYSAQTSQSLTPATPLLPPYISKESSNLSTTRYPPSLL